MSMFACQTRSTPNGLEWGHALSTDNSLDLMAPNVEKISLMCSSVTFRVRCPTCRRVVTGLAARPFACVSDPEELQCWIY